MKASPIDEIKAILEVGSSVPQVNVSEWMKSAEIDLQAAIVTLLSEHGDLVQPPLPGSKSFDYCLGYFKRCLLENPLEGEFTNNRTVEGYTLQRWFRQLWQDRSANSKQISEMKRLITDVYKSGDEGAKYAVETAILEHLFEDPSIQAHFSDWQSDPELAAAYGRAQEWAAAIDRTGPIESPEI